LGNPTWWGEGETADRWRKPGLEAFGSMFLLQIAVCWVIEATKNAHVAAEA
jgi:hypothetical protein